MIYVQQITEKQITNNIKLLDVIFMNITVMV